MSKPEGFRRVAEPIVRDLTGCIGLGLLLDAIHQLSPVTAQMAGGGIMVAACLLWARYRG